MAGEPQPGWSFLTNHARVLLCVAGDPSIRLREIGARVGITERAVYRIVDELVRAGYVSRHRDGRRNRYIVHRDLPFPDQIGRTRPIGELLAILIPDMAEALQPDDPALHTNRSTGATS